MVSGPIELMAKARAGETDALGELCALYRNYMRMVVRTGLGPKLRERVELSDVVQDALVEVIKQFPQFTGQTQPAPHAAPPGTPPAVATAARGGSSSTCSPSARPARARPPASES